MGDQDIYSDDVPDIKKKETGFLFHPGENNMKIDYPELEDYDEFKGLNKREIHLCWLISNRTSPLSSIKDKRKRVNKAFEIVYPSGTPERFKHKTQKGKIDFPDDFKQAMYRMASFNPSIRLRAKLTDEYIFDKLNSIIFMSKAEESELDMDDKKKYADLTLKISKDMPDMVKRMEGAYGIKFKPKDQEEKIKVSLRDVGLEDK